MASFKAECVGGPKDGATIDLHTPPRDCDTIVLTPRGHTYQFSFQRMRWLFVGVKPQKVRDTKESQ